MNRRVQVRQGPSVLEWRGEPGLGEADLRHYFRLDGSHELFLAEVHQDAALGAAMEAYPGLRLLQQAAWEVFVAYILSQNSNIPKISATLEALAHLAGEAAPTPGEGRPRFPTPRGLAALSEAELRSTRMGYRAPLLAQAVQVVADGRMDLSQVARLSYAEAHARLVEIPGIGPKVADCIQLYGLGHMGAFPVDVWIERVLAESYFPRARWNYSTMGEWARRHWGPWAGYAQQYLFHYRRLVSTLPRVRASQAARRSAAAAVRARRARATPGGAGKVTAS